MVASEIETNVVIVGSGPVGMLLAYQLDRLGVDCLIAEQSLSTTKWPKMDLTNCRSMEILRILGLADDYRSLEDAVSMDANFDTIFVTGLGKGGRLLGSWKLPSVNREREHIKRCNDGTQAAEPGQRCSQIVFEAWLRKVISDRPKIDLKVGWKYTRHMERSDCVTAAFVDHHGQEYSVRGRYLVECDGGSSKVRRLAGIKMIGGQMPVRFHLVHFRSRNLAQHLQFGRFWHAFCAGSGFVIDQNEKDTFTAHYPLESSNDETIDPKEIVYRTLSGRKNHWPIEIDEILVHSQWQPSFSVAEDYSTLNGRVFLAGDSAHRNPPHGGYGMNSGVVDAIDIGWRLAAMIKGYGGELLLRAYSMERRPMMIRALRRSCRHLLEHVKLGKIYQDNWDRIDSISREGREVRAAIEKFIHISGSETLDRGIELDLRYDSPVVYQDGTPPLEWDVRKYQPSTRPGSRAPHVFLKDGVTSTYDLLGKEWTLFYFIAGDDESPRTSTIFARVAQRIGFPLATVSLHGENHVRHIWEQDLVLVRPDTHVAWRSNTAPAEEQEVEHILHVVSGKLSFPGYSEREHDDEEFLELVAIFTENQDDRVNIEDENDSI